MLLKVRGLRGCSQEQSRLRYYLDLVGFSSRFGFQVPPGGLLEAVVIRGPDEPKAGPSR